jgi:Xaa-Pro aminopeptidase
MLESLDHDALRDGLRAAGADAWCLFDFHGLNPVARRMLGDLGMGTRRLFVFLVPGEAPTVVAHRIELQPWTGFAGRVVPYSRWQELHAALEPLVRGRTIAMEISPRDSVPYLDRVPYGVVQLLESLGASVVPSGALVTQFAARWSAAELDAHRTAAEILADVARTTLAAIVTLGGTGLRESEVQRRVVAACEARGLVFDHLPIVGFGANAANPHYHPVAGEDAELQREQVILLDLFAGTSRDTVFADQTWMAFSGPVPPPRVEAVWTAVRDARDAAIAHARTARRDGAAVRGFELDRAAYGVLERAGFAHAVLHRTGHSIDRDLHGSGPHIDDFETHDDRVLLPGVGFSVEPGLYLPGEFGVRSEVDVYFGADGVEVTPREPQRELIVAR